MLFVTVRISPSSGEDPAAPRRCRRRAFALVELLVVIGIVALLLTVGLVAISRARGSAHVVQCLNQLRQIGVAFHSYCSDNSSRFPDPLALETTWESTIRDYLPSIEVLRCPADEEVFAALGSSYDWRDGGDSGASVAGRAIHSCRSNAVLAFEALPGWHRRRMMNAVRVDGSALSMDEQQCLSDLRRNVTGETGPR